MRADNFRNYMLALLFLRYLSDNYKAAAKKEPGRKAHYVILPEHLWANIAHLARTQDGELLNTLQAGFSYIEHQFFESTTVWRPRERRIWLFCCTVATSSRKALPRAGGILTL